MFNRVLVGPMSIIISHDKPAPDPETVRTLKISMAEIGLLNPITVQRNRAGVRYLVAGRNRLEAAIQLCWDSIDAIELPDLDKGEDAGKIGKLAEIAENLHRREIGAIERSELITAWAELREGRKSKKPTQVAQVLKGGRGQKGGISAAARDLGMSRDAVARAVKIATLSDEVKITAENLGLADNQAALLEAARATTEVSQLSALQSRAATGYANRSSKRTKSGHLKLNIKQAFLHRNLPDRLVDALIALGIDAPEYLLLIDPKLIASIPALAEADIDAIRTYRSRFLDHVDQKQLNLAWDVSNDESRQEFLNVIGYDLFSR